MFTKILFICWIATVYTEEKKETHALAHSTQYLIRHDVSHPVKIDKKEEKETKKEDTKKEKLINPQEVKQNQADFLHNFHDFSSVHGHHQISSGPKHNEITINHGYHSHDHHGTPLGHSKEIPLHHTGLYEVSQTYGNENLHHIHGHENHDLSHSVQHHGLHNFGHQDVSLGHDHTNSQNYLHDFSQGQHEIKHSYGHHDSSYHGFTQNGQHESLSHGHNDISHGHNHHDVSLGNHDIHQGLNHHDLSHNFGHQRSPQGVHFDTIHHIPSNVNHEPSHAETSEGHKENQHVEYFAQPKYEYLYEIKDPHTGDNKFQRETRDGDNVKGVYSLHDSDGSVRTVSYSANKDQGFNAVIKTELKH